MIALDLAISIIFGFVLAKESDKMISFGEILAI
jgi:hypothetical protein